MDCDQNVIDVALVSFFMKLSILLAPPLAVFLTLFLIHYFFSL